MTFFTVPSPPTCEYKTWQFFVSKSVSTHSNNTSTTTMLTLVSLACLVLCAMGAHIPQQEQRGVFFVLPSSSESAQQQHITPDQVEEVMSQLRQEDGSDSGVYHIILPDGRLQRVEYTTAPVAQQHEQSRLVDAAVAQPAGPAALLAQTAPARLVTSEEEPAFQPQPAGPAALLAQTTPARLVTPQEKPASQLHPAGPAALLAQSPKPVARSSDEVQLGPDSRLFLLAQPPQVAVGPARLNEEAAPQPTKYVASVQYTDVQPITGPVYSYNNQPLTRVVRFAPIY